MFFKLDVDQGMLGVGGNAVEVMVLKFLTDEGTMINAMQSLEYAHGIHIHMNVVIRHISH